MDELRNLLMTYVKEVEGTLGIVLCDRDGIPILRCTLEDCPDSATRPAFLSAHAAASEQAGKMGLGNNETVMAVYQNYQVVHLIHAGVVITVIATADALLRFRKEPVCAVLFPYFTKIVCVWSGGIWVPLSIGHAIFT
ncbi:ragulator complex protein LAMTOR3-A isoform X1 [Eurytemora carolleeae]|uniref:ragulator complex protein LAMTOR3-A isoform X1 n=1 Tax=Eurytemora carolleeae TaxID=1294199 RepID=UPI000C789747|nr:ragulator complex protein LAMTOR3-A isoform X1 [Eurytemora carolleeae]|eukprot:XP_023337474.1 ragulator complex protein LAMTOR3-A-like isoform X1 [Eurytemora affinis]